MQRQASVVLFLMVFGLALESCKTRGSDVQAIESADGSTAFALLPVKIKGAEAMEMAPRLALIECKNDGALRAADTIYHLEILSSVGLLVYDTLKDVVLIPNNDGVAGVRTGENYVPLPKSACTVVEGSKELFGFDNVRTAANGAATLPKAFPTDANAQKEFFEKFVTAQSIFLSVRGAYIPDHLQASSPMVIQYGHMANASPSQIFNFLIQKDAIYNPCLSKSQRQQLIQKYELTDIPAYVIDEELAKVFYACGTAVKDEKTGKLASHYRVVGDASLAKTTVAKFDYNQTRAIVLDRLTKAATNIGVAKGKINARRGEKSFALEGEANSDKTAVSRTPVENPSEDMKVFNYFEGEKPTGVAAVRSSTGAAYTTPNATAAPGQKLEEVFADRPINYFAQAQKGSAVEFKPTNDYYESDDGSRIQVRDNRIQGYTKSGDQLEFQNSYRLNWQKSTNGTEKPYFQFVGPDNQPLSSKYYIVEEKSAKGVFHGLADEDMSKLAGEVFAKAPAADHAKIQEALDQASSNSFYRQEDGSLHKNSVGNVSYRFADLVKQQNVAHATPITEAPPAQETQPEKKEPTYIERIGNLDNSRINLAERIATLSDKSANLQPYNLQEQSADFNRSLMGLGAEASKTREQVQQLKAIESAKQANWEGLDNEAKARTQAQRYYLTGMEQKAIDIERQETKVRHAYADLNNAQVNTVGNTYGQIEFQTRKAKFDKELAKLSELNVDFNKYSNKYRNLSDPRFSVQQDDMAANHLAIHQTAVNRSITDAKAALSQTETKIRSFKGRSDLNQTELAALSQYTQEAGAKQNEITRLQALLRPDFWRPQSGVGN